MRTAALVHGLFCTQVSHVIDQITLRIVSVAQQVLCNMRALQVHPVMLTPVACTINTAPSMPYIPRLPGHPNSDIGKALYTPEA